MARINHTHAGKYNRPARVEQPAAWADNGQGGNANAGLWDTVCEPRIHLYSLPSARGVGRLFQYMQLYPTAKHWAEMRYRSSVTIDATMTLVQSGLRYQILDAIDMDLEHVIILLPLTLYQSKGTP